MGESMKEYRAKAIKETVDQIAVMQAYIEGKTIEMSSEVVRPDLRVWSTCVAPSWAWDNYVYRVKAEKPSVDWSHVRDEIQHIAFDKDGYVAGFTHEPTTNGALERWIPNVSPLSTSYNVSCLASLTRGNVDWKETLISRPKAVDDAQ